MSTPGERKFSQKLTGVEFVAYAPTSSYEEEVEAFYMDLEKFYREDHAFYKVIIGGFNSKVGPRRTPEELHIPKGPTAYNGKTRGRCSPSSS
ncbi:hypothetical protein RB195_015305 [Necator americanus]|uniref:Uncharacterized protein n=1 Tax=Necator americanus TaxID=51031 RepID=A0ABR1E3W9_NECAM